MMIKSTNIPTVFGTPNTGNKNYVTTFYLCLNMHTILTTQLLTSVCAPRKFDHLYKLHVYVACNYRTIHLYHLHCC